MKKFSRLLAGMLFGLSVLAVSGGQANAEVKPLASGYVLHSAHDNRCLDVYAGGAGPWVQLWNCNGQANQKFYYVLYPEGTAEIRTNDYWCVDGRWGKGASLERAQCNGSIGQRWRFDTVPGKPGLLAKSAQYPNLVWDVYGSGSGTKVQLWDYNGQLNQFWNFQSV
ncbi:RICIN domain-containing protein [Actinosynnema sp. NPDC047251]|uniref:Ricin B lectin domain-containing protein n=1 Tax=Saccharothrix espanaensis (strain ATCC 51144 / DSM 44229 / JCM 9112 / NBRC 15066 / NRRL 15764) TaxID=1179773 RepID=K0K2U9_SACES|nr:RICIN domain-containing protein [Saccharothrix espanaensis]CCH31922.1 hypothetical protein BN6_46420 [Saccharothrix espanaensis DSM 44229]